MIKYYVTVRFAPAGTTYVNQKTGKRSKSDFGHVWYETHSSDGERTIEHKSYGWSTGDTMVLGGRNNLNNDDYKSYIPDANHHIDSIRVEISKEQYDRLGSYPNRAARGEVGGFGTDYNLLTNSCVDFTGWALADAGLAREAFDGTLGFPSGQLSPFLKQILYHKDQDSWVLVERDGRYFLYDPAVIALTDAGIQTIGENGYAGALYDFEGNGIATATGFTAANTGILFIDRNANNKAEFDEIFGEKTLLNNGEYAKDGYEALANFDSNSDGKISSEDAEFANIKVLIRKENGELEIKTLQELDIVEIDLDGKAVNKDLGDGNILAKVSTYTKSDGTKGEFGDLDFATNPVFSYFVDEIQLTEEQQARPDVMGIGHVRNLREAAATSDALASILDAYAAAETKAEQLALLDGLKTEWAKTAYDFGTYNEIVFLEPYIRSTTGKGIALTPSQERGLSKLPFSVSHDIQAEANSLVNKVKALDAFSGLYTHYVYVTSDAMAQRFIDTVKAADKALSDSIYQALLFQTRLKPYVDELFFKLEDNLFSLDFSQVIAKFQAVYQVNPQKAIVDLGEFLQFTDWNGGKSLFTEWLEIAQNQGVADEYLALLGEGGFLLGHQKLDSAGRLKGSAKNDILQGSDADDRLEAGDGDDVINAADGNDRIYGGNGSDTILGGRGNDRIEDGDGDDLVDAGEGSDYISGGKGSDTYVFKGDFGKDTIYNYSSGAEDVDTVEIQGRNRDVFRRLGGGVIRWRVEKGRGVRSKRPARVCWRTGGRFRLPAGRVRGRAPVVRQVRRRSNRCVRQTGFAAHRRAGAVRSSGIQTVNRHHAPACGGAIRAARFAPLPDSAPDVSGGSRARCRRRT